MDFEDLFTNVVYFSTFPIQKNTEFREKNLLSFIFFIHFCFFEAFWLDLSMLPAEQSGILVFLMYPLGPTRAESAEFTHTSDSLQITEVVAQEETNTDS